MEAVTLQADVAQRNDNKIEMGKERRLRKRKTKTATVTPMVRRYFMRKTLLIAPNDLTNTE
jgi:hypothetical protein